MSTYEESDGKRIKPAHDIEEFEEIQDTNTIDADVPSSSNSIAPKLPNIGKSSKTLVDDCGAHEKSQANNMKDVDANEEFQDTNTIDADVPSSSRSNAPKKGKFYMKPVNDSGTQNESKAKSMKDVDAASAFKKNSTKNGKLLICVLK